MQVSDPIGDMLSRIRNALAVDKRMVTVPLSRVKKAIAEVMVKYGYIEKAEIENGNLVLYFNFRDGKSPIMGMKRVSKPGIRVYAGYRNIPRIKEGVGICVLSTSKGIMSGEEARRQKVGGELLFIIW